MKPLEDFAPDRTKASGRTSKCRPCDAAKSRRYYAEHRAERAAWHAERRDDRLARMKIRNDSTRDIAEAIYGGACEWCGALEELEFDHVDDDGREHRDEEAQRSYVLRIATSGARLPDRRLRLLCRPCHRGPGWKELRARMDANQR